VSSGSETRAGRTTLIQFRARPEERRLVQRRALDAGYATVGQFLRAVALGDQIEPRGMRELTLPMTSSERAAVRRRATENGFEDVVAFARMRVLDRDPEGMTVSRALMELRKITGLQKHMFNNDQLRDRTYADLLGKIGIAIEAVVEAAARGRLRRGVKTSV